MAQGGGYGGTAGHDRAGVAVPSCRAHRTWVGACGGHSRTANGMESGYAGLARCRRSQEWQESSARKDSTSLAAKLHCLHPGSHPHAHAPTPTLTPTPTPTCSNGMEVGVPGVASWGRKGWGRRREEATPLTHTSRNALPLPAPLPPRNRSAPGAARPCAWYRILVVRVCAVVDTESCHPHVARDTPRPASSCALKRHCGCRTLYMGADARCRAAVVRQRCAAVPVAGSYANYGTPGRKCPARSTKCAFLSPSIRYHASQHSRCV